MLKKLMISSIKAGLTLTILLAFHGYVQAAGQPTQEEKAKAKPAAAPQLEVQGTPWGLIKLEGKKYKSPEGAPRAYIRLMPQDQKVVGNTGCNEFGGTYTQQGDKLNFKLELSTKNTCPKTADMDVKLMSALKQTERFKRDGKKLKLYKGDKVIANFREIASEQMAGMEAEKK